MKIGKFEKKFVNSKRHAQKNIELIERLFKHIDLKNISNVLEIGCGIGITAEHLYNKYNMNVVGTDVDPEQIMFAKKHQKESKQLKFMELDATILPFENQEFDMVISMFVLHHIGSWDKTLTEISRVLKPNGYFIFYDLAYSRFTTILFKRIVKKYGIYTIHDIITILKSNNIESVYKGKPHGTMMKHYAAVFQKKS
jgi:ubiquinone/menaquinone biosynthesis C-methylase UbiE